MQIPSEKKFKYSPKFKILPRLSCLAINFFILYFDSYLLYILVPHNNCFKSAADMLLFCGDHLNFGTFLNFFPPGIMCVNKAKYTLTAGNP
jgi:hypothetical protein